MVYATDWQEAWLRQQQERRRTRPYHMFWAAMGIVASVVIVIGISASQWLVVAIGAFLGALLAVDWWRYFPHDRQHA